MFVQGNTRETEKKLNNQIKQLEARTKEQQRQEVENLNRQIQELDAKLQSKAAEKARIAAAEAARASLAQRVVQSAVPTANASQTPVSGSKADWMRQAGIPEAHWSYVDMIVTRESGWNPNAVNRSSGACGLGQQLPCGKWAGAWNDPVAALRAMTGYVNARYGGWAGAAAWWNSHHWY